MPWAPMLMAMGGGAAVTGADGAVGCTRGVEAEHPLEQQIEPVAVGAGQQAWASQRDWMTLMDPRRHWKRCQCH